MIVTSRNCLATWRRTLAKADRYRHSELGRMADTSAGRVHSLADRTNGRAYATVLRLSVCL